ncbi:MAG: hypothetical protein P4L81_01160 [Candidatus Pacebacteria bacterium]|nr:hypothetical protein [Candidatus Paceibacterota bacterium]
MSPALFFLIILWTAYVFAKVEIAIEGKHGWAENLPTWRLPTTNWASIIFFSGKPATGYHIWMEIFILSMLHSVYVYVEPSWMIELQIFAYFFFFSISEDFLWFALNPAFGIKNFRKEKIWWHRKHWWWIAPRDYYLFLVIGTGLYLLSFVVR